MRSKFKWIFTLLVALTVQLTFAQERTITGTVSDSQGTLPGANVVVKGTTKSTQTDIDGKYSISAKTGEVLVFSFVGMTDKSVTVGASNTVNVTLDTGVKLNEVVVEGYRNTTKKTTAIAQSTVNSETIENRPNASFLQTLQGQVAGLNIETGSGQPGSRSTVLIRGLGSLSGYTDPLYVIDGVQTYGDNFRSIDPNDIQSVTVLKDAAAVAIYGNRGGNGVIVVTTKRGGHTDGKMRISYSTSTGFTDLQRAKYNFANSRELLAIEKLAGTGRGATLTDQEIASYPINTDWVDYFFRTGTTSNHQLSIENPGKFVNSYTSVGYTNQKGILFTTGLERFNVRNNISVMSQNEKFKVDNSLYIGFSRNNEATNLGTGAINRNYVLGATLGVPYVSPNEYQNSQQLLELYQADGTLLYTPLFLIDKLRTYVNNTDEMRVLTNTDLAYELFKGFKVRSRTGMDYTTRRFNQSEDPISLNALLFLAAGQEFGGFEDINNTRIFRFSQLWQADYTRTFAEKHTITWLADTEYNFSYFGSNNMRQNGLNPITFVPNTGVGYIGDTNDNDFYVPDISAARAKFSLISYFSQLDYDFDKRFGVVGTFRYDGTSRFLSKNRWGTFWSVAGRWNIDSESFMKNASWVNTLKLRVSYGTTGNQVLDPNSEFNGQANLATYALFSNAYNGQSGLAIQPFYPFIWEQGHQADVGLDFGFLKKNRLRGSVDLYQRLTTRLINAQTAPPSSGLTGLTKNVDTEVHNNGVEVDLSYDVISNQDLKVTLHGNWAYNENRVKKVFEDQQISGNIITENNGLAYEFYLIPYVGVNKENGNLLFLDHNGNVTENPSTETDRRATGKNDIPVYQGSFGLDIDYKGFYASSLFSYAGRAYRLDFDLEGLYDPGQLGQFTVSKDLLNAWTPTNTNTNVPSLTASNAGIGTNDSDRFLVNASYIRIRNLQVGYHVPKKYLDKTFLSEVSIFTMGENLYTWSKWRGFDAESNRSADQGQYPTPKIWTLGVNLKF